MQLYVSQTDWGNAQANDIEKLLKDTASHLNRLLRSPFEGRIHVEPSPETHLPYSICERLQINHLSSGYPSVTVIGTILHTNSHTSSVMCYPVLSV